MKISLLSILLFLLFSCEEKPVEAADAKYDSELYSQKKLTLFEKYENYNNKYIKGVTDENVDSIRKTRPFNAILVTTENDELVDVSFQLEKDSSGRYKSIIIIKEHSITSGSEFFDELEKE